MKLGNPSIPLHDPGPEASADFTAETRNGLSEIDAHNERRFSVPKPRSSHDGKRQRVELAYPKEHELLPTRDALDLKSAHTPYPHIPAADYRTQAAANASADLSPCHICHRKPTVRTDLDSYADCEGCGRRTCYICIRECLGSGVTQDYIEEERHGTEEEYDALAFSFHGDDGHGIFSRGKRRVDTRHSEDHINRSGADDHMGHPWDKGRIVGHRDMICSRCCVERGTGGEVWCLGCLRAEEGC